MKNALGVHNEIDVAGATEAMDSAGGVEHLFQSQDQPQTPAPATQEQTQQEGLTQVPAQQRDPNTGRWVTVPQPDQQQEQQGQAADEPFTGLNPNELSDELKQVYRLMQGDYTRKTQALAERSKQFDSYGDPEFVQQAVETYQQLQDPANWMDFHSELSEALQKYGLTPAQADATAAQEVQRQQTQEQGSGATGLDALNDPDLAPVKGLVESLQKQVDDLKSNYESQKQEQQVEQLQSAVMGELTRQENIIRQNNKEYSDEDVDFVYELSSFYDGNLIDAQQQLENYVQSRMARYLQAKQGAAETVPLPGGAQTSIKQPEEKPTTLDEAHKLAMQQIRELEAAGQI